MRVDFGKSIAQMKVATGARTDKELYTKASVTATAFACIKKGNPTWEQLEKLCVGWSVKPSAFVAWGE